MTTSEAVYGHCRSEPLKLLFKKYYGHILVNINNLFIINFVKARSGRQRLKKKDYERQSKSLIRLQWSWRKVYLTQE